MTKQITISQLEAMNWEVVSVDAGDHELEIQLNEGMDDEGNLIDGNYYNSYMYAEIKLQSVEEPSITYTIHAVAHNKDDRQTFTGAYDFTIEVNEQQDNELDAPGFEILDIDGDVISEREAVHQIGNDIENSVAWESAFEKELPTKPVEDIE